ncbi:hypothetical protein ACFXTH_022940 [Malus domestica]
MLTKTWGDALLCSDTNTNNITFSFVAPSRQYYYYYYCCVPSSQNIHALGLAGSASRSPATRLTSRYCRSVFFMQGMSSSTTNTNYSPVPQHAASPPIIILLTVLLVFFFASFFSIYFCKCFMDHILASFQSTPSGDLVGTAVVPKEGLDVSLIESFPTFEYASVKDFRIEKYGLECAICLVEFEDDSMLRLLTVCCHVFHKDCIDLWLESHKTCPFCRGNLEVVAPNLADKSPVLAHENHAMQDIHEGHDSVLLDLDAVRIDIKDEQGQDHHHHQGNNDNSSKNNNNMVAQGEQSSSSTTRDRDQDHDQNHDRNKENETERFSRSHSTGHSIVRPRAEEDRYTLRLPEHVKEKLIRGHHNWTGSCTTFGEFSRQRDNAGASCFGEASGSAGGGDVNNAQNEITKIAQGLKTSVTLNHLSKGAYYEHNGHEIHLASIKVVS